MYEQINDKNGTIREKNRTAEKSGKTKNKMKKIWEIQKRVCITKRGGTSQCRKGEILWNVNAAETKKKVGLPMIRFIGTITVGNVLHSGE